MLVQVVVVAVRMQATQASLTQPKELMIQVAMMIKHVTRVMEIYQIKAIVMLSKEVKLILRV